MDDGWEESPEIVWFGGAEQDVSGAASLQQQQQQQQDGPQPHQHQQWPVLPDLPTRTRGVHSGGALTTPRPPAATAAVGDAGADANANGSSTGNGTGGADSNHIPSPAAAPLPTPATHAYLGEAITGSALTRTDLEVGSTIEMPILSLPGVVLFPGESLPLRLHNPAYAMLAEAMLDVGGGRTATVTGGAGAGGSGGRGGGDSSGDGGERQAQRHLGVVNRLSSRRGGLLVRTSPVGTTAEIRSGHGGSSGVEDADGSGGGLAVMARGRHRFRLVEDLGWRRGVRYWKVVICPDHCPGVLRPPIPRAFRDHPWPAARGRGGSSRHWAMAAPLFVVDANSPMGLAEWAAALLREQREPLPQDPDLPPPSPPPPPEGTVGAAPPPQGRRTGEGSQGEDSGVGRERVEAGAGGGARARRGARSGVAADGGGSGRGTGAFPATAAAAAADAEVVVRRCRRSQGAGAEAEGSEEEGEEEEEEEEDGGEGLPGWRRGRLDPTLFSFWLAANLPLDDDARQELLMLDSVVMRLRLQVKHLEKSRRRALCCAGCGMGVAWEGDVFTLPGAEGVVGAYVNPMGYVHQTVTVRNARNLVLMGTPEEEHTWFPGYAWTAAYCERCPHHLGWRFNAINRGHGSGAQQRQQHQHRQQATAGSGGDGGSVLGSTQAAQRGGGVIIRAENEAEQPGPVAFFGLRRPALVHEEAP